MIRSLVICLACLLHAQGFAKIRILTFHYNQADFIELQYKTLHRFLTDEFELIVFNDARTEDNEKKIAKVCKQYGIPCVRFEQEWHFTDPINTYLKMRLEEPTTHGWWGWTAATSIEELAVHPSVRHSHVIQYALEHYGYDHDDIVVLLDGDNFLIQPISIRNLLGTKDLVAFNQRIDEFARNRSRNKVTVAKEWEMPWVVFIAFNPSKLPDVRDMKFHVDVVSGHPHLPQDTIVDTGAAIYKYLWSHPELKTEAYPWQSSHSYRNFYTNGELKKMELSDRLIQFIHEISPENVQFFFYEHFMHFEASSLERGAYQQKVSHVRKFIGDILIGSS